MVQEVTEKNKIRSKDAKQILHHCAPQIIYTQVQWLTLEIFDEKEIFGPFHNFKKGAIILLNTILQFDISQNGAYNLEKFQSNELLKVT